MKALYDFFNAIVPLLILAVIAVLASAITLFLGWLFTLVTALSLTQAMLIVCATFALSTYTLYTSLPKQDQLSNLVILAPLALVSPLPIILLLTWLISLVTSLEQGAASLVATSITLTIGYVVLDWLVRIVNDEVMATLGPEDDLYGNDDDDEWEEDLQELPEGNYTVIRNIQTDMNLLVPMDELAPEGLCPCGSGRKFRNCHGVGQRRRRR